MSLKLVGMCFDLKLSRSNRDVLRALCDSAEDVPDHPGIGINVYLSVDRIAWKSDYKKRQVIYALRELEAMKALIPKAVHPVYATTEFEIDLTVVPKKPPFRPKKRSGGGRKLPKS
jgi:hypothetical protein